MTIKRIFWNSKEHRIPAFWRLLIQVGIALTIVLGISAIFQSVGRYAWINTLVVFAAMTLSVWITGRFIDRRRFVYFGFDIDADWWIDFFFGLVLGLLLMTGIFVTEYLLDWITIEGTFTRAVPGQPLFLAFFLALVTYICVGFYEELVFRGYQVRNVAEGLNTPRIGPYGALISAWLLTSIFFGMAHLTNQNASLVSTLNIVLAGILLGLGYVFTGRLAIPIGLHISWNFAEGIIFGFPVSGNTYFQARVFVIDQQGPEIWTGSAFGPEAGLLGVIAMLIGCLLTVVWISIRNKKFELHSALSETPAPTSTELSDAGASD